MPYTAGQEIDAFCTRCKVDNVHVIVAVWEGAVKKVQCKSCNHEHLYRRPRAGREKAAAAARAARPSRAPGRRSHAPEPSPAERWKEALSGRDPAAAKPYSMKGSFAAGDLIRHTSFGQGLVAKLVPPDKMEVMFEEGTKVLVHRRT
jgi:hypothetical protein